MKLGWYALCIDMKLGKSAQVCSVFTHENLAGLHKYALYTHEPWLVCTGMLCIDMTLGWSAQVIFVCT
jgi:hypothetical protein